MHADLVDLRRLRRCRGAQHHRRASVANLALASGERRIKGLKRRSGVPLLKRGRRGVTLTAAGESLLGHARIIMQNVETCAATWRPMPMA